MPLGEIAQRAGAIVADRTVEILTICAHGQRSLRAAHTLAQMGYANVASVAGGTALWIAHGLPLAKTGSDDDFHDRYSRHLRLPEIGVAGQRKL